MKKILAFTVLLFTLTSASQAQQASSPKKEASKEERKKVKDDLNLSSEQASQMKEINKDFKDKFFAIKGDNSLTEEQKKEKFKELNRERMRKTNSILTPEQQRKMSEYKKSGHKRHKQFTK
jgi:Spy/CpxP family protein refolding chaperone